jgi:hypothetical protein
MNAQGQTTVAKPNVSTHQELLLTSINPTCLGQFEDDFQESDVIPKALDVVPTSSSRWSRHESKTIQTQNVSSRLLKPGKDIVAMTLVKGILVRFFPLYQECQIHTVAVKKNTTLYINVKHRFSRLCVHKGSEHLGNRVYFSLSLKFGTIEFNCYDQTCRAEMAKLKALKSRKKKSAYVDASIYCFKILPKTMNKLRQAIKSSDQKDCGNIVTKKTRTKQSTSDVNTVVVQTGTPYNEEKQEPPQVLRSQESKRKALFAAMDLQQKSRKQNSTQSMK